MTRPRPTTTSPRLQRRIPCRRRLHQPERVAERIGEVRFEVHDGTDLDRWFAALVELEGRTWKGRAGTALADDPEQQRQCSPGILLTVRLIGWAARAGVERFEFMGESEPWKEVWAPPQQVENLHVSPPTPVGVAALCSDAGDKALQRLAERARSVDAAPSNGQRP